MRNVAVLLILAMLLAGCQSVQGPSLGDGEKPQVLVTFYPLHEFASAVAGDKAAVSTLLAPGTEPHDFEPGARDMKRIGASHLFVYNGGGMEPWVEKALQSVKPQAVVETSAGLQLRAGVDHDHPDDEDEGGHDHELDPHIWLDPVLAQHQVSLISEALAGVDPANRSAYEANTNAYQAKLATLDAEFAAGLRSCSRREIITAHAAYGYLASRYDLKQIPLMGLSAEAEPKPKDLAAVVQFVRENQVAYIFFESAVSEKVAQVIAKETGATALVLHPLEIPVEGKDYLSAMRQNLEHLRLALGCE